MLDFVPADQQLEHHLSTTAANAYKAYQESKTRIAAKKHDARDEIIVALWDSAAEALTLKAQLEEELTRVNKQLRDYAYNSEILESRLAVLQGTMTKAMH